jgi:hypothetical protein
MHAALLIDLLVAEAASPPTALATGAGPLSLRAAVSIAFNSFSVTPAEFSRINSLVEVSQLAGLFLIADTITDSGNFLFTMAKTS